MKLEKIPIRQALLSVSDKTGLLPLAKALTERNVKLLSSGGTAAYLRKEGIAVEDVSGYTGQPEILDGRLKTLHPKIFGGLLAVRDNKTHMAEIEKAHMFPIDLVVVNLYPFEQAAARADVSLEELIEEIDIGGPSLLRAAAKNHQYVTALTSPDQYEGFLREFQNFEGCTSAEFRRQAAGYVFQRTAQYDTAIAAEFQQPVGPLPARVALDLTKKWDLRYGENPHQKASFYLPSSLSGVSVLDRVHQGKELSYNNLMDIHAAIALILDFESEMACAIFKHTNPCGVGVSKDSLQQAYERALSCDPVSAFGGIVIFSKPVDVDTAQKCVGTFTEIVIAPGYDSKARDLFAEKKNLRVLEIDLSHARRAFKRQDIRAAADGYLVQESDQSTESAKSGKVVTDRQPTPAEMRALDVAWKVCRHVKSNAIVLANETQTVGVGAGQMSRVDACKIAVIKAETQRLHGMALASDAFFPFRDTVDEAHKFGVTAVIQPGGSVRDSEVISAANEHEMTMVLTGTRHFRH